MENRFALIIATSDYEDPALSTLVSTGHDADGLLKALSDPSIGEFKATLLMNRPSYEVNEAIESFFAERKKHDIVLIYFSGHGIKDYSGSLYLATHNTKIGLPRSTAVATSFVNDVMRHCDSRRQVLILDCCYSGAFARGMVAKTGKSVNLRDNFEGRGRVILTASDEVQYAFEGDHLGGDAVQSVFTQALVQGLTTGEADQDRDGYISIDELYEYAFDHVSKVTPNQSPRKWAFDVEGHIKIAKNATLWYPEMISIPDGEFIMGSDPEFDPFTQEDETPQHPMFLPAFSISKTPITNTQYFMFTSQTNHRTPNLWIDDKPPRGLETYPVVNISLYDATAYTQWLSKVTNKAYRLPTEAEWEKASRGSDGRLWPWGNYWDPRLCNTYESGRRSIVPVGSFPEGASPYGVLDMGGNLFEWTNTIYRLYPYDPNDGREDVDGVGVPVLRGCGCQMDAMYARCASRLSVDPRGKPITGKLLVPDLGFRIVEIQKPALD